MNATTVNAAHATVVGVDVAKTVFQLAVANADWKITEKHWMPRNACGVPSPAKARATTCSTTKPWPKYFGPSCWRPSPAKAWRCHAFQKNGGSIASVSAPV